METEQLSADQAVVMLLVTQQRLMALEIMVRALTKTHPDSGRLVEAVRYYEEAMDRSLVGLMPDRTRELLQSYLDQAGLG